MLTWIVMTVIATIVNELVGYLLANFLETKMANTPQFKGRLIAIATPLTTLFLALLIGYCALYSNVHGALKFLCGGFVGGALTALITDFIPKIKANKKPMFFKKPNYLNRIDENTLIEERAVAIIKANKGFLTDELTKASEFYANKEYQQVLEICHSLIDKGIHMKSVYNTLIYTYLHEENYELAEKLLPIIEKMFVLDAHEYYYSGLTKHYLKHYKESIIDYTKALELSRDDFYLLINRGHVYGLLGNYEAALIDFNKVLEINPEYPDGYNHRGYNYNLMENYGQAIIDFDKAIELKNDVDAAYPYSNRGLAKIKLGQIEEGLTDIKKSIELDDKNAYAYRNLGIYHADKGELNEALNLFEKSKSLDANTHLIDDLLIETKARIDALNKANTFNP
jgi:tetratricopeptide (TPR) repeat protein